MMMRGIAVGLALTFATANAADDRPRLHPLPADSRNARTGLPPGSHIPAFDVVDIAGKHQNFDSLRGPKGLVLLLFRSGEWSPQCRAQLVDLDSRAAEFRKRGFGVAAISYDPIAILRDFAEKRGLTISLLSDEGSQTIKAFGLLNTNMDPVASQYGVPFPGTYILDERGTVSAKYFNDDSMERFTAGAILTHELMADGSGRTVIDTPQMTLSYSASDASVTAGNRVTLLIDIDPKPKMHVFAIGTTGFIPAEWQMGTSRGWISFPVIYPAGRSTHLSATGENAPVYDRHVRLIRDVILGQEAELTPVLNPDRSASVEGTFRFQACDDKECFPPRLFLLRWNFKWAGADAGAPK